MTFVATAPRLVVEFMDSGLNKTTRTYGLQDDYIDSGVDTVTDILALLATAITAIGGMTTAEITGYSIVFPVLEDTIVTPGAGVEIENTAELVLRLDAPGTKTAQVNVPAPPDSIFVSTTGDGRNIVEAPADDASVNAFVNWLIANATVSDGETLAAAPWVRGRRVHKASRKG